MLTRGAFTLAILLQASLAMGGLRTWKPVVLQGSQLRSLLGQREDHLEVLAFHCDRLEPIPFQVDDVLPDGRFALPSGPHAKHENEVEILGPDDQVVLMVSDLGPRTPNDDPFRRTLLRLQFMIRSAGQPATRISQRLRRRCGAP